MASFALTEALRMPGPWRVSDMCLPPASDLGGQETGWRRGSSRLPVFMLILVELVELWLCGRKFHLTDTQCLVSTGPSFKCSMDINYLDLTTTVLS